MEVQAKRVKGYEDLDRTTVCYWKVSEGFWQIYFPCDDERFSLMGGLRLHKVEEHEDGTITVTPSILVTAHHKNETKTVHGFLTKGVWTEV
jgi:hypothetical protein